MKISDAEVARRLNIDPKRYSHYVNDKRQPDFAMLKKICKVLRISYNDLFAE